MSDLKTIFVGTDFTELGDLAISTAAELARDFSAARIHIVHATGTAPAWITGPADIPSFSYATAWEAVIENAHRSIESLRLPPTNARITREVRLGSPARELALAAAEIKADLGVVASHRRGRMGRFVLGSVASALVRASPCPIAVVGEDRRWRRLKTVVAAVDGSPISLAVLERAIEFASKQRAHLKVVALLDLNPYSYSGDAAIAGAERSFRKLISTLIDRAKERAGDADVELVARVETNPKEAILAIAQDSAADLLVLGTSGHNAWRRMLLGSTATRVLADAPCPVLVVPAPKDD